MDVALARLACFTLILTRIAAFFVVAPVFSWQVVPFRVKTPMAVSLAVFFAMVTPVNLAVPDPGPLQVVLWLVNEALYGTLLGLIMMLLFSAVRISGRIVERQMGLAMAQVLDPFTKEQAQPLGLFLEILFITLFLSVNAHHLFLKALAGSYQSFAPGTTPSAAVMATGVVQAGSVMLLSALRLAAPILAVFILFMVVLAIFARIVPEMNILFVSFPIRVGLGLVMLALFLPLINSYLSEFTQWMTKLLPV